MSPAPFKILHLLTDVMRNIDIFDKFWDQISIKIAPKNGKTPGLSENIYIKSFYKFYPLSTICWTSVSLPPLKNTKTAAWWPGKAICDLPALL